MTLTRHLTGRMAIGLLVTIACLLAFAVPVTADGGMKIVSNDWDSQFGDHLTFRLVAQSDAPIVEASLRYRRDDSRLTTRVDVPIETGKEVQAEYTRHLERGEIPPGTPMVYFWTLRDANGQEYRTEPMTFTYQDDRFDWKSLREDGITLYWYEDESNARSLLTAGTKALRRLQDDMGVTMEKPIKIYVYETSKHMQQAVASRSEGYDARVVTLGMVVSEDTMLLLGSHRDARLTIAHELSHLVVGQATRNPYADIPRWLDEGLAMYAEGELPASNRSSLEQAIREGKLISVRSLSGYTGDPTQVDLFYGEVYSLVAYLIGDYGKDKIS